MFDSSHRHQKLMSANTAFLLGIMAGGILVYWGYPMALAMYCEITGKDPEDLE